MSKDDLKAEAARWLRYGREDLAVAEHGLGNPEVAPRHCCFHAQQAAEKVLKAVLVVEQIEFPYVHNLNLLRNLIPIGWRVKDEFPDLALLSQWAVEARYPGDWTPPTEEDARVAVEQARGVVESIEQDLSRLGHPE